MPFQICSFCYISQHFECIQSYIDYYNHRRIKLKLAGLSLVEYRLQASREV
ncbi:IS3 family transposase [Listeria grandensis]|uniref:IS3 family transposase n=1 Tax=Listeria grandensis TaxID=1494963 RepID=UPI003B97EFD7